MLRKIIMEVIPHGQQRYDTIGDYWEDPDGTVHITVSDLGIEMYNAAVMLHEFEEYMLLRAKGIPEPEVLAFDLAHQDHDDPGMLPEAPYHKEHVWATASEMSFLAMAGASWKDYCKTMDFVCDGQ